MKAQFFRFDGSDSPVFAGIDTGDTWNGWACPMLTTDSMESLSDCLAGEDCPAFVFDEVTGQFSLVRDGDVLAVPCVVINGEAFHVMTGFGYCFSECDKAGNYL